MVVVAVAGGAGDLGQPVVESLVRAQKHEILVLTRKLPVAPTTDGPKFVAVDYEDIKGTAQILESHAVHTIISVLGVVGPGETSQRNLIVAADQSPTTKRFLPSEYTTYIRDGDAAAEADEMNGPIVRARKLLSTTSLQWTRFANGFFMDYFGYPSIPTTLRPFKWGIDVPSRRATIPGTGNEILATTYSKDVGRFIARLVDDDEWPEYCMLSGADTCLNEIVALAEKVTGDKFHVTYDSVEDIKAGKATAVSPDATVWGDGDASVVAAALGSTLIDGAWEMPADGRLNDRYPELKPMGIEALITAAFSKED